LGLGILPPPPTPASKGDVRDSEREQIDHDIEAADREIDDLVYDLYGLTKKERALIES
jgi:hypothetical protein